MIFFRGAVITKKAISQKEFCGYSGGHEVGNSIAQQLVAQLGFSHFLEEYFDVWNGVQAIGQQPVAQKECLS